MKAVVAAFSQEKALVGAFSVITILRMELFEALPPTQVIGPPWPRRLMRVFLYRDNVMRRGVLVVVNSSVCSLELVLNEGRLE